jgi:hypothetical protein
MFMLFFCDAPSWVCLLYAQVWYGEVPGAPDMKPRFIFGYVMPVVLWLWGYGHKGLSGQIASWLPVSMPAPPCGARCRPARRQQQHTTARPSAAASARDR